MRDDNVGCLDVIVLFITVALIFFLAWIVATSGLPDWLKFLLLK